jgi:serine/threonine-protein kinase
LSGKVRVSKENAVLAVIGVGECFGEMSYLGGQPRVATVTADTDCILMKISAILLDKASESIQRLFYKNFAITLVHRLPVTIPPNTQETEESNIDV